MKTGVLINNVGKEVTYIKGLEKGDVLVAKILTKSVGDIGFSGQTYDYEAFIPGKEYKVDHITKWDYERVAYVADEDNTLHFATPNVFDLKTTI